MRVIDDAIPFRLNAGTMLEQDRRRNLTPLGDAACAQQMSAAGNVLTRFEQRQRAARREVPVTLEREFL